MKETTTAPLTARILLSTGLFDCLVGGLLILYALGFLPVDLSALGLPRWAYGLAGAVLFFPGLALAAFQLTRPVPPG